jgi:alkanesulfonate monooxygenase SsuD/methylene tetrahydromethanopterin reductase-like flavin-dependent oxidoreductase (luciferase family)
MAAAQVAMVDHLTNGRLVLGIGPGVPADAEAIGDTASDRNRKTQEALDQMRRIWSDAPPYNLEGEYYTTSTERSFDPSIGLGVAIKPLQQPHPPIAITSIRPGSSGPRTAGASGWSGISATYAGAYVVRSHIESYLEGRRAAGMSEDAAGWRVARSIFVADDEVTARRYAQREDGAHGFYFQVMRTKLAKAGALDIMRDEPGGAEAEVTVANCLERLVIAGTPESVAAQLLAFRERVGPFGTLLYTGHDWVEPELARRSMELMATEVWPRVEAALTSP